MIKNPIQSNVSVLTWESPEHWAGWGKPSGMLPWAGYNVEKPQCKYQCEFHGDQSRYSEADVIIFEPQPFGERGDKYPPYKPCGQKYMMFSYETPNYFPIQSDPSYLSHMDWKMTYQEDSDIRVSLMCPWGYENGIESYRRPVTPPFSEKKGFAVFVASNCNSGGAIERTKYVEDLMKYIPVDSYGLCLQNQPKEALNRNTARERFHNKMELFSKYKFILAFENSNFTDYVTEKLSHAYLATSLPIYMGPDSVDNWTPGEKSLIKTSDFKSPKHLADFLINLAQNEQEYNSYFKWKKLHFRHSFVEHFNECLFTLECRVCEKVVRERTLAHSNENEYLSKPRHSISNDGISKRDRLSYHLFSKNYDLNRKFYKLHEISISVLLSILLLYVLLNNLWVFTFIYHKFKSMKSESNSPILKSTYNNEII